MRALLIVLLVINGIGAVWAGILLSWRPDGSLMHMPLSMLQFSPFPDFRIPGLILLTVIGIGSLIAAAVVLFRGGNSGRFAQVVGAALVIWIVVQMIMLRSAVALQVLYLCLGIIIILLGERIRKKV